MEEIIRDQAWQFVGAIVAIISLGAMILFYRRQRMKKSFAYELISSTSLISVADKIEGKIQITYESEPVKQVHLFVLKLINDGDVPILASDFDRPVEITFGKPRSAVVLQRVQNVIGTDDVYSVNFTDSENTTILSVDVSEEQPENIDAELNVENHTVKLEPVLLNSQDSITITCLLNNFDGKFDVKGRIVGVRNIKQISPRVYRDGAVNLGMALMILLFLIAILLIVFKPEWILGSLGISGLELLIFGLIVFLIYRMAIKALGFDLR